MKKRVLIAILLFAQMLPLGACARQSKKYSVQSFSYFDTVTTISGYAENQAEFDRIAGEILRELAEYHRLFTIYERYDGMENLCTINEKAHEAALTVDKRIIDMLLFAKDMHALTNGRVNIAMGSVLSIWHAYRGAAEADSQEAKLPSMDLLARAAAHTDIAHLVIDAEHCTVRLTDPGLTLDVGAVAKGYAVEMAARSLASRGISGYMINVGGNVRTVGAKDGGDGWTVGIQNPNPDADGYLAYLTLIDLSLVTSGSYQRYYTVNGKAYHHIIDPETQMPADRYHSVSVLCESSALGDALSTALFCMPLQEGQALIASLDGVEAMWLTSLGERHASSGFPISHTVRRDTEYDQKS